MLKAIVEDFGNGGTIDGDLVVSGDLTVSGGGSLSFDEIIEGTQVIDVTNTEALLVRKNGDGGDVFVVDTTNSRVGIGGSADSRLHIKGATNTNAKITLTNTNPDPDNIWSIHANYNSQELKFNGDSTTVLTLSDTGSATFAGNIRVGSDLTSVTSDTHLAIGDSGDTHFILGEDANNHARITWDASEDALDFNLKDGGTGTVPLILTGTTATFAGDVSIKSTGGNNDPATLALWNPDVSINADDTIGTILAQGSDSGGSPPYLGGKIEFNADAVWDTGTTGYYPTRIDFFTESNSGTVSTASPRMTLDSSGRVGIGSDSPDATLHLQDGNNTELRFTFGSDQYINKITNEWAGGNPAGCKIRFFVSDGSTTNANEVFTLDGNSQMSLSNNDNGTGNTIFGKNAAKSLDSGSNYNVLIGDEVANGTLIDIKHNVAVGADSMQDITQGDYNTGVGSSALHAITTGSDNVGIGRRAGDLITTGTDNILIGSDADPSANSATNQIVIGHDATGVGDNTAIIGNSSTADVYMGDNGNAWSQTSDGRLKENVKEWDKGLDEINSLRVVEFNFKKDNPFNYNSEKKRQGIIAQEAQEILPEMVKADGEWLSANTEPMVWALVKAVQELSAKVEELEKKCNC